MRPAGNSVVVKPSEYTPLDVLAFAKVLDAPLPDGVLPSSVEAGTSVRAWNRVSPSACAKAVSRFRPSHNA